MPEPTDYRRYQPGHDDASLKPALWCLTCTEDDNHQADVRLIWVQPDEEAGEPTLADWNAIADEHEAKRHAAAAGDDLAEALKLLSEMIDPDDCQFDHHGGCQAHGFLEPAPEDAFTCPHADARKLLARIEHEAEGDGEAEQ